MLDSHNLDIFFGFLNHVILEWVFFFLRRFTYLCIWSDYFPLAISNLPRTNMWNQSFDSTLTHLSMGLIRWWSFLRIEISISCPLAQQTLINQILFSVIQFKWLYVMIIRILINNAPCSNSLSTFHSTIVIVVRILVYQERLKRKRCGGHFW